MTEDEITEEIILVTTAIHNLLKTGLKYEIGTGSSRRIFEMSDLKDLRLMRTSLSQKLRAIQGESGLVLGF